MQNFTINFTKNLQENQQKPASFFKLKTSIDKFDPEIGNQFKQLNTNPDFSNSFIFTLNPGETKNIQIIFHPEQIGTHQDLLVVRNNLTIIEVQLISGAVGTAELSVNNLPPMKNSLFFNEIQQATTSFRTTDVSRLILKMGSDDFEHCNSEIAGTQVEMDNEHLFHDTLFEQYSHVLDKISKDDSVPPEVRTESHNGIDVVKMSQVISGSDNEHYKSSYKSKQGIVLRAHLILKNVGEIDLHVFNVIFDGESCFSRGIEVTYCQPFTVIVDNLSF